VCEKKHLLVGRASVPAIYLIGFWWHGHPAREQIEYTGGTPVPREIGFTVLKDRFLWHPYGSLRDFNHTPCRAKDREAISIRRFRGTFITAYAHAWRIDNRQIPIVVIVWMLLEVCFAQCAGLFMFINTLHA
jgi:hypothetical protein